MQLISLVLAVSLPAIPVQELTTIGEKIQLHECGTNPINLTFWNRREAFPSLGVGHFIWHPQKSKAKFQETFPQLIAFFEQHDVEVPEWTKGPCPWPHRKAFYADLHSPRMVELRTLLTETTNLQALFMLQRLEEALPQMVAKLSDEGQQTVKRRFEQLSSNPQGLFALVDYVNFKGMGVSRRERYNGEGWGLLQVLLSMKDTDDPLKDFTLAAVSVLHRRVKNAPPDREEFMWHACWLTQTSYPLL